jgi:hypothetical protein
VQIVRKALLTMIENLAADELQQEDSAAKRKPAPAARATPGSQPRG